MSSVTLKKQNSGPVNSHRDRGERYIRPSSRRPLSFNPMVAGGVALALIAVAEEAK